MSFEQYHARDASYISEGGISVYWMSAVQRVMSFWYVRLAFITLLLLLETEAYIRFSQSEWSYRNIIDLDPNLWHTNIEKRTKISDANIRDWKSIQWGEQEFMETHKAEFFQEASVATWVECTEFV